MADGEEAVWGRRDVRDMERISSHISGGEHTRRVLYPLYLLVCLAALAIVAVGPPTNGAAAAGGEYPWPVKPFDQPHPVRGNFGDPRTVFAAPPTLDGLMTGGGRFSFHFGVDISAANGTPVYPVVSGTVGRVSQAKGHEYVEVTSTGGRSFQYWHIRTAVRSGQKAEARETVLGRILSPSGHVHLAELRNGETANPLATGHLLGYTDTVAPSVASISLRTTDSGPALMPNLVRGRVVMVAEAYDTRELPIAGAWGSMPVTPALLSWKLMRIDGSVVARGTAADFRRSIPSSGLFWGIYARGTYQNMSVFADHYSYGQPGSFLFKLTRSSFDTRTVGDGVYDLVVTAADIRGNASVKSLRLTIRNHAA